MLVFIGVETSAFKYGYKKKFNEQNSYDFVEFNCFNNSFTHCCDKSNKIRLPSTTIQGFKKVRAVFGSNRDE